MGNILITSAGKRVTLVRIFQEELAKKNRNEKVFTTEMNPEMSPAAQISDFCFKINKVTAHDYINDLLNVCINNDIKLVIPTIDTELITLSKNKEQFERLGIFIIVSSNDFILTCRDKRNTNQFFERYSIKYPKPIDIINAPTYPIFAKPYDGSLSKDLYIIKNENDITSNIISNPKLMFMEYVDQSVYSEYTVDMYFGRDHYVKSIVPRERIEIRAGEINKGFTRKNYIIEFLRKKLNYIPGVIGCICVQLFFNKMNNDIIGIEINPRFGGGYPLSYYAGANYPRLLIDEYIYNQNVSYSENWKDNTLMLRFDSEVIKYES